MVHIECVIARNQDPEMHALSRVPGARGRKRIEELERERKESKKQRRKAESDS